MTIHLFNLSKNITADSLEILFEAHGRVLSAALVPGQGASSRNAVIKMGSGAEVQVAVARFNNSIIDGKIISARIMHD
jgi:hypothetical protein